MKHPYLTITPENAKSLNQLDPQHIDSLLKKHGALIFSGFSASIQDFDLFSSQFCAEDLIHGGERERVGADDRIQNVTIGTDRVPGHIEMGRRPDQPDLAWFFCQNPAEQGGELLLIDGLLVAERLSTSTKVYFRNHRIQYKALVEKNSWQRSFGFSSFQKLQKHLKENFESRDVQFEFRDDESFMGSFSTSAYKNHPHGLAFANSILGPYTGESGGLCSDEHGTPIPENILNEIENTYESCTHRLSLKSGDFVLIDNHRVMHGRENFRTSINNPRKILAKFMKQQNTTENRGHL